jgi:hypothetical protein
MLARLLRAIVASLFVVVAAGTLCASARAAVPGAGTGVPSLSALPHGIDRSQVMKPMGYGGVPVYDSIIVNSQGETSSDIVSLGFECCTTKEFGDGLVLTTGGGRLKSIEMILVSYACQNGLYFTSCQSAPHATFNWPITINVYGLTGFPSGTPGVGPLLATRTQTVAVKYRPSANPAKCGPTGQFLGLVDKQCDYGLAVPIAFDFVPYNVTLPAYTIVSVAFNTSDAGYNPVGDNTPCYTQSSGCPYDWIYVSAFGNGGRDTGIGSAVAGNGVFDNFANPYYSCTGTGSGFEFDNGCWGGAHPEIEVMTQT